MLVRSARLVFDPRDSCERLLGLSGDTACCRHQADDIVVRGGDGRVHGPDLRVPHRIASAAQPSTSDMCPSSVAALRMSRQSTWCFVDDDSSNTAQSRCRASSKRPAARDRRPGARLRRGSAPSRGALSARVRACWTAARRASNRRLASGALFDRAHSESAGRRRGRKLLPPRTPDMHSAHLRTSSRRRQGQGPDGSRQRFDGGYLREARSRDGRRLYEVVLGRWR